MVNWDSQRWSMNIKIIENSDVRVNDRSIEAVKLHYTGEYHDVRASGQLGQLKWPADVKIMESSVGLGLRKWMMTRWTGTERHTDVDSVDVKMIVSTVWVVRGGYWMSR